MSRPLAIIIWSIAIITAGLFAWPKWRLPESVSAHGAAIDHQFKITMIVIGIGFALTHAALGYAVWRYRAKDGERAPYSHGERTPYSHGERAPYSHGERAPYSHGERASYSHGDARVEIVLAACV